MKYRQLRDVNADGCRAPQGARGLKCKVDLLEISIVKSRPARGAWVEMCTTTRRA